MPVSNVKKDQIKKEIVRCSKDPAYFLKKYAKISHPIKGEISFRLYPFQEEVLGDFADHQLNIVNKARQMGLSTLCAGMATWITLFGKQKNVVIMATKINTAANMLKKVKLIYEKLPPWLRAVGKIKVDNRHSLELSNGSAVKAITKSGDAGRSEAITLLIIDEAAHIDTMEDLWTGLAPTISTGGRVIALSSPNGQGNWFHKTCSDAMVGQNDFNYIELPWYLHPERDDDWFNSQTRNLSPKEVAQEYLCSFNASGDTVISPEDLLRIKEEIEEPIMKRALDRNLWIWKPYNPKKNYMVVADVARGDGEDYSAFHTFDVATMEQVAEYKGKIDPDSFTDMIVSHANEYGTALIIPENNTIGFMVGTNLEKLGYTNIYYHQKGSHEYIPGEQARYRSDVVVGFATTAKTRNFVVAKLEEFIRNHKVKLRSERFYQEAVTFIWKNQKPQAMRSSHDDLIMACAIGCYVKDTVYYNNIYDQEHKKAMLTSIYVSTNKLDTSIEGMLGHKRKKLDKERKELEPFLWVIKG